MDFTPQYRVPRCPAALALFVILLQVVPAHAAIIQTTQTNNTNLFVDGGSGTRTVNFTGGSVNGQILEVRGSVRFRKADGQSYGVNNGGTPYYNQIDLRLTSPSGTTVSLISPGDFNPGFFTGGFGFGEIHFRAGFGYSPVNVNVNTPQAGDFRATGNMRDFENESTAGTWTVYAGDTVLLDGLSVDRVRVRVWTGDPQAAFTGTTGFGNVLVGTNSDLTLSAANTGDTRTIQNDSTVVSTMLSGLFGDPVGSSAITGLGTATFGNLAVGAGTADRVYRFSPTSRAAASATVDVTTDGGNASQTLTGQGVAPQALIDATATDAGLVRIGADATVSVSLSNVGDGNLSGLGSISNLNGTFSSASGTFSGSGQIFSLADAAATSVDYTYAPTARGIDAQDITLAHANGSADGTNSAGSQAVTLTGQAVGPEFTMAGDTAGVLDFGNIELGQTASLMLTLGNDTPDGDLGVLTDLSLLASSFAGLDIGDFNLVGFAPTILSDGETLAMTVDFTPNAIGARSALLAFDTDQNAPLGIFGSSFSVLLQGVGAAPIVLVPEPSTGCLMLAGILALLFGCHQSRRMRNRQKWFEPRRPRGRSATN